MKGAFIGFGEVNSPKDLILKKCEKAACELEQCGVELFKLFPIVDDSDEIAINYAISKLNEKEFDFYVICIAGWIPTHAVIKVCEHFKDKPMILWGLCGYEENGRIVTTADQAGTTALRKTMQDLGYTFKYIYDVIGTPSKASKVYSYAIAAVAARRLRFQKVGMAGYRDMNLYGTLYDGVSLKKTIGPEIETFEMLEIELRYKNVSNSERQEIIDYMKQNWAFLKEPSSDSLEKAAGYYLAIKEICEERNYKAISLKDVDGMKKLLNYPPAPIFMLISDILGLCTIPENDSLGAVTQLIVKNLTGQCAAYLEFYEFFEKSVLMGVPDYVPTEIVEDQTKVIPASFGELSEGILNVSKLKTGEVTLCRLTMTEGKYYMHIEKGMAKTPPKWEEAGWTQPAPQLPGLEIELEDVEHFAEKVMCQHYILSYGDNTTLLENICHILGICIIR